MNKYEVPALPYEYDALAPYISSETLYIHHDKHHQAYADKLNAALDKHPEISEIPLEILLRELERVPEDIRTAVNNNGGGYLNHNLYWAVMSPNAGGEPEGDLREAIEQAFGGFPQFKQKFSETALNQFGSGYGWLVKDKDGALKIYSLPNQDSPLSLGDSPILLIDVWEHAYYLDYQNRRAEYIENFWNVINWLQVEKNFLLP